MLIRLLLPFVLQVLCFHLKDVTSFWSDFTIVSVESMNGTSGMPVDIDIKIKRIKKASFGLSGKIFMNDYPSGYTLEILVYHSSSRNNIYKLVPFKIPEGEACGIFNTLYRKYVMNDLHPVSDFPYTEDPDEDLCLQFEKGKTYNMRNYVFNKDPLPQFAQTGMYKAHFLVRKDGILQSGLEVFVDLS